MSERPIELSMVVPFYNESSHIALHLQRLDEFLNLSANSIRGEIIYVDDGSTDKTFIELQKALPPTLSGWEKKFIKLDKNLGKGGAVACGVRAAHGEFLLYTDFDFSISLHHVQEFLQKLQTLPQRKGVIIASRKLPGAVLINQNLGRKWLGHLFHQFMRWFMRLPYRDTQCGFKMFDTTSAQDIFSKLHILRFAFDVEVLKRAQMKNLPIVEVPAKVNFDNHQSTINLWFDPFVMLKDLMILRLKLIWEEISSKTRHHP